MNKTVYYKHKIENLIVINKIVTIHYFEFDKNFKSKGESHDFWEMVYADKEYIICGAEGETIRVEEGEALFHKPNEFHCLSANKKTAPNVFIISFECNSQAVNFFCGRKIKIKNDLKAYIRTIIKEAKETFKLPVCNPAMKRLEVSDSPNLGGEQAVRVNLELFLIMLMRSEIHKKNSPDIFLAKEEFSGRLSNDIIKILESRVYGKINIGEISRRLSYSKSFLCTQFKKSTGHTIIDYYLNLKTDAAKRMLRENDYSVKQISDILAFDSPNYFCKAFKRYTKMTPGQFKNSIAVK